MIHVKPLIRHLTKKKVMWKVLPAFLSMIAVIVVMDCVDDDKNTMWVDVNEESLVGDWGDYVFEDYGDTIVSFFTFSVDGKYVSTFIEKVTSNCYLTDWQIVHPWFVKGDTLAIKLSSKNSLGYEHVGGGETGRYLVKVSSDRLRLKLIDIISASGDTVHYDDDWLDYKRIDGHKRKDEFKNKYSSLPVFSKNTSIAEAILWVNNTDNKAFRFWHPDTSDDLNYDYLRLFNYFEYIEKNSETGDTTVYSYLNTGDSCVPAWYTTTDNRLILKNLTTNGSENLGDLEFEYSIAAKADGSNVLTTRRVENGELVGDIETWKSVCDAESCNSNSLSKMSKIRKRTGIGGRLTNFPIAPVPMF